MNLIRWALFFARTWAIPFCLGMTAATVMMLFSQVDMLKQFSAVFDQSFQAAIQSCAK